MNVGIIGAGYAGTALALFLARAGHRVSLYERVPEPGPVGAGILLQPTGMCVLDALGLLDAVLERGALVRELVIRRETQRRVMTLAYSDMDELSFAQGMHRGALYEVLLRAAQRQDIALDCGCEIARARPSNGASGGWRLWDAAGALAGEHELLVVAGGAHSALDVSPAPARHSKEYPWGAAWGVLPDPERIFAGALHQRVRGTRRMLGFLPTGLGPRSARNQTPLVSVFWSLQRDTALAWREQGIDAWRDEALSMAPEAAPVLAQLRTLDDLVFTSYADVSIARLNGRALVYVGDAAHAMSPQLGQGANLALLDAWVLARCLTAPEPRTLDERLHRFASQRAAHLDYYQWATRFLTPFFQSGYSGLGLLRDLAMPVVTRFPLFRRLMLESMAGVRTGLLPKQRLNLAQPPAAARWVAAALGRSAHEWRDPHPQTR
ncbi:MAG: FAD-dependent monooxygenase [Myxococcales bacterium]|nr:FAD-dependent monooxygenase [Myxococcales bacterium]